MAAFQIKRSKGFEGMAASRDGSKLYALLEGPVWNEEARAYEAVDGGKQFLRVLEFDVKAEQWTGRHWKYVLEGNSHAIGDFNMIDDTTGLIIERDNGEGTADKACPQGEKRKDCFSDTAKFKRIYKVELTEANAGSELRKVAYVDLMNIQDPNRVAKKPLNAGMFTFRSSPSRTWTWWMPAISWSATTTICRSAPAVTPTVPTTTSWCCWRSATF